MNASRDLEKRVEVPDSYVVSVHLPGGVIRTVDGRVGKMIEWILDEHERIESIPFGWMGFDMTPTGLQPKMHRSFERIQVRPKAE